MGYDDIPPPEPKPVDETNWLELKGFIDRAVLRGQPHGDEKCANCLYYLDPDESLHYCWHPQIRILVGGEWWCQWWEAIPDDGDAA